VDTRVPRALGRDPVWAAIVLSALLIGGLAPTIATYVAVAATPGEGRIREFHSRLFKWRVGVRSYLAALGVPLAFGVGVVLVAQALRPGVVRGLSILPWDRAFLWFPIMVVGGGLEELGWRGVAQPALEHRTSRVIAALIVGLIWGIWHLPVFSAGLPNSDVSFAIFVVSTIGLSLILAWLYGETRSILLCILFQAALNTTAAMGFPTPMGIHGAAGPITALLEVMVGLVLVLATKSGEPALTAHGAARP